MKNIHNAVSDMMDIIDRRNRMTTRIEHRENHYIRVHIHQELKYLCIEVLEDQPGEYDNVVLLHQTGFSPSKVNLIMNTFISCVNGE